MIALPLSDWHEALGPVLWWRFPITEPPYVGTPNDCGQPVEVTVKASLVEDQTFTCYIGGWPGYHTHFTMIEPPEGGLYK
jgi:hypothetical protein